MSKQIIKQPNGKYAIWSTVADAIIVYDATRQDIIDEIAGKAFQKEAERLNSVIDEIDSGGAPYFQFTKTWDEALTQHNSNFPGDIIEKEVLFIMPMPPPSADLDNL